MAADEPHMAGRPATLDDENSRHSALEESMDYNLF
jgi:hypothetical protein